MKEPMCELEEIKRSKGKRFLFFVERSPHEKDYKKYEQLRMEIWREPNDYLSCPRNMAAENYYNEGSSLFIGVYTEDKTGKIRRDTDHFIAFAYGYAGVKDKNIGYQKLSNLNFYSQYAAVRKDYRNLNLGVMLKQFQKKMVRDELRIPTITCTFDPLTGVNAYRNIHKLGMEVVQYKESFYKGFSGALNRSDVPSDRFYVLWRLKEKHKRSTLDLDSLFKQGRLVLRADFKKIKTKHGQMNIEVSQKIDLNVPKHLPKYSLIEIPYDFYNMLQETDVSDEQIRAIPLDWRMRTREAFKKLFKAGYRVQDFQSKKMNHRHRNFYVLVKREPASKDEIGIS